VRRVREMRALTLPQQFLFLRTNDIAAGSGYLKNRTLTWRFSMQPTPLSRSYLIRIDYREGNTPNVFVEDPEIEMLAGGRRLPHVYQDPLRLCLYKPGSGQWGASKRIDQTLVPWTAIWLFYFEEWLVSGVWKGEGDHPSDVDDVRQNRRMRRLLA